jgi:hypothetical protein
MRQKLIILSFVFVCSAGALNGQNADRQEKSKFVVVPSEQVLLTTAEQPGCPLQFEDVKFLAAVDGGGTPSFEIRNKGTKPIRSFTVGGPDWTMTWSEQFTKKLLMPGEKAEGTDDVEIVSLSNELRDKLNLKGPMRSILVIMVVRVEFADGSTYSAESTYEALKKYTEKLDNLIANAKSK